MCVMACECMTQPSPAPIMLTNPINIEQAKGTLRVARGLLRKSEPAKAGSVGLPASAASAAVSAQTKPDLRSVGSTPSAAATSNAAAQDEDLLGIAEEDSV